MRKSKANISLFYFSKQLNSTGRIFELRMLVNIKLSLLEDYFRNSITCAELLCANEFSKWEYYSLAANVKYCFSLLSYEQVIFMNYFNVIDIQIQGYFCWNSEILFLGNFISWVLFKYSNLTNKDCLVLKDAHFS